MTTQSGDDCVDPTSTMSVIDSALDPRKAARNEHFAFVLRTRAGRWIGQQG
jgi:hypothetical protein